MNKIGYEERLEIYRKAKTELGFLGKCLVTIEKTNEVQNEITKAMIGQQDREHMAEAVAEATIILEQMRDLFNMNEEVCRCMDMKMAELAAGENPDKEGAEQ